MKILVTGFTPFGGEQINPSWEAVERLPDRIGEAVLLKREIPTEFDAACAALRAQLDELRPDAVLSVGQYGGANCIRVERVAVNLRDARIADNAGAKPVDEPVVPGAPDASHAPDRRKTARRGHSRPAFVLGRDVRVQQSPLLRPARERAEIPRHALRLCPRAISSRAGEGRQRPQHEPCADDQSTGDRSGSDRRSIEFKKRAV